jgi:hypothetical protein
MWVAAIPQPSASQALRESPLPLIRSLAIDETESEVTLTGQVHSYYFKQLAQETILPALGRRRLVNRIVVDPTS